MGAVTLLGAATFLTLLGGLEARRHRRRLEQIPIRIHVNGTRGKSSVTRLIAAGLRAGGYRTLAKTTGTLPRLILPDGSEQPIERSGRPNINEQFRVVAAAVACRAEALVVECMALQPRFQAVCELKLIRSTHGVITNARPDHLDVMGPDECSVARALAGTTPARGTLLTAERDLLDVFEAACRDRGTRLAAIGARDVASMTAADMAGFPYVEHPENVALALCVCAELGVERETALAGMWHAIPDPGVTCVYQVDRADCSVVFVNGFAANDPESTAAIFRRATHLAPEAQTRVAIVNCRSDRAERSEQLAGMCARTEPADYYLVIGSGTASFVRPALAAGLNPLRVRRGEDWSAEDVFAELVTLASPSALAVGMGNIAGIGMELVELMRARCTELRSPATRTSTLREAA